jgi:hypothetical protein
MMTDQGHRSYIGSDHAVLERNHQFVRDDAEDEANASNWEVRMARRYYDKLYKE